MGSTESAPKPSGSVSTGGDNAMMDSVGGGMGGVFSSAPNFSPSADIGGGFQSVGIGGTNRPADVQTFNQGLRANGITPSGLDTVADTGDVMRAQQEISIRTGEPLKIDGNFGPKTMAAAQKGIDSRTITNPLWKQPGETTEALKPIAENKVESPKPVKPIAPQPKPLDMTAYNKLNLPATPRGLKSQRDQNFQRRAYTEMAQRGLQDDKARQNLKTGIKTGMQSPDNDDVERAAYMTRTAERSAPSVYSGLDRETKARADAYWKAVEKGRAEPYAPDAPNSTKRRDLAVEKSRKAAPPEPQPTAKGGGARGVPKIEAPVSREQEARRAVDDRRQDRRQRVHQNLAGNADDPHPASNLPGMGGATGMEEGFEAVKGNDHTPTKPHGDGVSQQGEALDPEIIAQGKRLRDTLMDSDPTTPDGKSKIDAAKEELATLKEVDPDAYDKVIKQMETRPRDEYLAKKREDLHEKLRGYWGKGNGPETLSGAEGDRLVNARLNELRAEIAEAYPDKKDQEGMLQTARNTLKGRFIKDSIGHAPTEMLEQTLKKLKGDQKERDVFGGIFGGDGPEIIDAIGNIESYAEGSAGKDKKTVKKKRKSGVAEFYEDVSSMIGVAGADPGGSNPLIGVAESAVQEEISAIEAELRRRSRHQD